MITKSDTAHLELFTKANNVLRENNILQNEITNVDDYFTYIEDLKNLIESTENTNDAVDPIFLILPADEPLFEIDANSRKIRVPDKFVQNGIGVQGDEVAEVLYFSIDRYFDIQDLYNKEIYIQWEAPLKAGATGGGDQGLSLTINKSLSFDPGKVVFGWPIGEEITRIPGQVKFSVRFYERGLDTQGKPILTYSFSTLTSAVKVAEGLDFDISNKENITQKVIDKKALIYNNLKNSEATNVSIPALEIAFAMFYPDETTDNARSLPEKVDLDENNQYRLIAQAYFNPEDNDYEYGAGNISYNWTFKNKAGLTTTKSDEAHYKETTANKRDPSKLYYYKDSSNGKYILYTQDEFPISTTLGQIYEKYASLVAVNAGHYQVEAVNRYGSDTTEALSDICLVPFAAAPIFEIPNKNIIIQEGSSESINLEATITAEDGGSIRAIWKESTENNNDNAVEINNTEKTGDAQIPINLSVNPSDINKETGKYYFINASNSKNNDTTFSVSEPIRITYPIIDPDLKHYVNEVINNDNNIELYWPNYASELSLKVETSGGRFDGDAQYQWQRRASGSYQNIEGAINNIYEVSEPGTYKCIVSISYNGTNKNIESSIFTVYE